MLVITGTFRIPKGSLEKALPAMTAMITASRQETGCLAYSYALDIHDNGLVHVHEEWEDEAAFDAHVQSRHLLHWRSQFSFLGIAERRLTKFTSVDPIPI